MTNGAEISAWIEAHRADLGPSKARYEKRFAREILPHVDELRLSDVETQTSFRDLNGKQRRIDFTIREGEVRVAIEIDGWDKTGRGAGMTHSEFVDWMEREAAIVAQGWRLIRFSNTQVQHRPKECAEALSLVLAGERALMARIADAEAKSTELTESVRAQRDRAAQLTQQLAEAREHEDRKREDALVSEIEGAADDRDELANAFLAEPDRHRLDTLATQNIQLEKENRGMKTMAVALAIALAAVAVIVVVGTGGDDGPDESRALSETPSGSGSGAAEAPVEPEKQECLDAVSWQEAPDRVGESLSVRGGVVSGVYATDTDATPTYLNIGKDFPNDSRFVAVIFGDDRSNFSKPPEDTYEGKDVAVSGEVETFNGVAEIIVNHPNDITVC